MTTAMPFTKITLDVAAGAEIMQTCRAAVSIAAFTGCDVVFTFNGTEATVKPGEDSMEVANRWSVKFHGKDRGKGMDENFRSM